MGYLLDCEPAYLCNLLGFSCCPTLRSMKINLSLSLSLSLSTVKVEKKFDKLRRAIRIQIVFEKLSSSSWYANSYLKFFQKFQRRAAAPFIFCSIKDHLFYAKETLFSAHPSNLFLVFHSWPSVGKRKKGGKELQKANVRRSSVNKLVRVYQQDFPDGFLSISQTIFCSYCEKNLINAVAAEVGQSILLSFIFKGQPTCI